MALTLEELKSFYNGKKVLVTGHTGFKGSWLVRILTLAGAQVTGYALNPPTDPNLFEIAGLEDTIHSVVGDVRDLAHLRRVFDEVKPEIVFHLAAQPIVRESYKEPVYTYETNVMGTVNILECVRLTDTVRSFLNVTTDKVYENKEWEYGYRECDPLDGYDPYSNSKSCSELVTHSYKQSFFQDGRCAVSTCLPCRKCDRWRRLCKRPHYSGLCPRSSGRKTDHGKKSTFHQTVSACIRTAGSLSDHCHGTVQRQQISGLLQCGTR